MKRTWRVVAGMVAFSGAAHCWADPVQPATLVLTEGNIITMRDDRQLAQALAIRGNQIVAVGSKNDMLPYIGSATKVIHLNGRTVMPGFIDAHTHPVQGGLDMGKCSTDNVAMPVAAVISKVQKECLPKEGSANTNSARWLEVVNINPSNFVASAADLDRISNRRPVILSAIDGHSAWVNSVALKLAHIDDSTPNPAGGKIERDAKGHATGFLIDDAQDAVRQLMPKLTLAQRVSMAGKAFDLIRSKGITSVQDAYAGPEEMEVYEAMEASGQLRLRVRAALKSAIVDDEAEYQRLAAIRAHFQGHALIRADSVKIFSDGVIEYPTQSAAMIEPYLDASGNPTSNYGGRYFKEDVLNRYVARLDKDGFTIHVHSIGDYTTHTLLNAFEMARAANGVNDNRHQITHLEVIAPADYARFAQLNVFADMQLYWAQPEEYSVEATRPYISAELYRHLYPAGSLKKAGATIVGCSDWPVDVDPGDPMPNTPLAGMQVAITRANPVQTSKYFGQTLDPDEALDLDTMLAAYTINAARAMKQESSTGSIEVGKLADLVVLGRNPMTSPVDRLAAIPVHFTVFDGNIVYQLTPGGVATGH